MARSAKCTTGKALVTALKNVDNLSRYHKVQLVNRGFLTTITVKGEGRGRPMNDYVHTGKARGLLALSEKWK